MNSGTIDPGISGAAGTLHFGGSYTQIAGGILEIDLASLAGHDELTITGSAALAGTLVVSLLDNFVPQPGSEFEILTAAGFGGSKFTNANLPSLPGGLLWNINYGMNAVTLLVTGPGDYNNNGAVDAADYVLWCANQGTNNVLPNDPIGGTIGTAQYDQWRGHFGQSGGSGSGAATNVAVPEPATLLLLTFAAAGCCVRRGRSTQKTFINSSRRGIR